MPNSTKAAATHCPAVGALTMVVAAALWSSALPVSTAAPSGWELSWGDEFTGAALDATKWTAEFTTSPHNNERQAYLPQQVTVSGGNMVITSENVPYGGKQYRSGRVHSNYTQQYGRWEVRADLPTSKGMWPAIWLLPDVSQYPWPTQGEIDIMENRGHQPHLTSSAYHYSTPAGNHTYRWSEQTTARFGQPVDFHSGFHTYGVEWDATKLRLFVDDVHWYTIYNADTGGFLGRQTAPMWTVLNTAVGGDFLGGAEFQPDATTVWPQQMLIDYVRIYDRNDEPIRFANGGFDDNDGSLAGWSVFGNVKNTNNVSIHNEAVAAGDAALKLFGQFTGGTKSSGVSQGISVSPGDEVSALAESFIRSADSISGTGNSVRMKIEFYRDFGGKQGTTSMISESTLLMADGATPNDVWSEHSLSAVAPAGAVEARLAFVFTQVNNAGGAIHIDNVSFKNLNLADDADANADGSVDGADFLQWQRQIGAVDPSGPADGDFNFDGRVDGDDLAAWKLHAASVAVLAAVPEPASAILAISTLAGLMKLGAVRLAADSTPAGAP